MTIQSTELMGALLRTERLVVRLDEAGEPVEKITAEQALKFVRFTAYTGTVRGRHGQIRSIRPVCTKRSFPVQDSGQSIYPLIGYNMSSKGAGRAVAA